MVLACCVVGCGAKAGPFGERTAIRRDVSPASAAVAIAKPLVIGGPSSLTLGQSGMYTIATPLDPGITVSWSLASRSGSMDVGTIASSGIYQSPSIQSKDLMVTVVASPSSPLYTQGTLQVTLVQPTPVITSATATTSVIGSTYLVDVFCTGLADASELLVNGEVVPATRIGSSELQATLRSQTANQITVQVENFGSGKVLSETLAVAVTNAMPSVTAAARFLDQATFGPTDTSISQLQQTGLSGFLDQQFAVPATLIPEFAANNPAYCGDVNSCIRYFWWGTAIYGNDQLRQRVAFALSEMWVVSSPEISAYAMPQYLNVLSNDAFSNWYTVMRDVTLTPTMGSYLNMVNSLKPTGGAIANQNFAREMMQLFSIGTSSLNNDGTQALDGRDNPIPNYSQAQIDAFARAYTGWTYPNLTGNASSVLNWAPTFNAPMAPVEEFHDTTAKTLLNGVTLPAGQTAEQDLDAALQNLFNHPSLPPFVCKQLIQHLITSNPSPAYVSRVTSAFLDNGKGIRGDMQAVIRAILLDPEARAGDDGSINPTFGHLREPIVWLTGSLRGLNATTTKSDLTTFTFADVAAISLGQEPQASPSVFNFFSPNYQIAGSNMLAPEFQLEQTASVITRLNIADEIVFSDWIGYFTIDFAGYWASLARPDPNALVDKLSRVFLHEQMSAQMRTSILTAISGVTDPTDQARMASYLVICSPQYKINH